MNHNPIVYYDNKYIYQYNYDINNSNNRWKRKPKEMAKSIIYLCDLKYNNLYQFDEKSIKKAKKEIIDCYFVICMKLLEDKKFNNYIRDYILKELSKYDFKEIKKGYSAIKLKLLNSNNLLIIKILGKIRMFYLKYLKK